MLFHCAIFIAAFVLQGSYGNVHIKNFYPYGSFEGDSTLARGTGVTSPPINLTHAIPFGGPKTTVWVSSNGYISFQGAISHSPGTAACDKTISVVAPFKSPVDTSTYGDIYYREEVDKGLIARAASTIQQGLGIYNVRLTSLFIATWVGVTFPGYTGGSSNVPQNTFQAVIATDGTYSYAIFNYNMIKWTQGDFEGNCGGDSSTGIGGACQAEIGYTLANSNAMFLDGSCGDAALSIAQRSNIDHPGVWLIRVDNVAAKPIGKIAPVYLGMLGHNSIELTLPDTFNTSNGIKCTIYDKNKGALISTGNFLPGNPNGYSSVTTCPVPFLYSFGNYTHQVEVLGIAGSYLYHGSLFILLPEPHVTVDVINASLASYMVELNITWDLHYLNISNSVNITLYVWDNLGRNWGNTVVVAHSIKNIGQATVVLNQQGAAIFLTDHVLIGVGSIDAMVFSQMIVFDLGDQAALVTSILGAKGRADARFRFLNPNRRGIGSPADSVTMVGHVQLVVPVGFSRNATSVTCHFQDPVKGALTGASSISVDKSIVYCSVPFLYSYGNIQATVTARDGAQNVSSGPITIDVLPSFPDLDVVQKFSISASLQYAIKLQFAWNPAKIPPNCPYLNSYIFVFDETNQAWQQGLLVNPTQIRPNATGIELPMSDEAVTAFFDNKAIFGLCYITSDNNWCILSKIFHQ